MMKSLGGEELGATPGVIAGLDGGGKPCRTRGISVGGEGPFPALVFFRNGYRCLFPVGEWCSEAT